MNDTCLSAEVFDTHSLYQSPFKITIDPGKRIRISDPHLLLELDLEGGGGKVVQDSFASQIAQHHF